MSNAIRIENFYLQHFGDANDNSLSKSERSADLFIMLTSGTKFGVQFNLMGANGGG